MRKKRETILILDFGSQYTQLIARRVRENGVFSEIVRFDVTAVQLRRRRPDGLILSGGPASVYEPGAPQLGRELFGLGLPILGICYGMHVAGLALGGNVRRGVQGEYGRASFQRAGYDPLLHGLPESFTVWMSHGDEAASLPQGFRLSGKTADCKIASAYDEKRRIHFVQFHPEVLHTDFGGRIVGNFLRRVCECKGTWSLREFIEETCRDIGARVGGGGAVAALSGGVDSSVACVLAHRAVGSKLICIYVDHGLERAQDAQVSTGILEAKFGLRIVRVDASERFLRRLRGVSSPEKKRRIIGGEFIRVFEEESVRHGRPRYLVQGTLYPDVIESVSWKGPASTIKTHHNVGGLPRSMRLRLVEPLRELFKDEVREVGRLLGIPRRVLMRHPFPGPGLAVRIIGSVSKERVSRLREADRIFLDELRSAGLYHDIWQAFVVLLPVKSVGVMGDRRTYEDVVALRAVTSKDGMTADWARLPAPVLSRVSNRIVNEVRGINRVVYDVSSKPPATIEWE
ncbi:MAG: glutamine-hydrolyzing GMP synthase [Candidatus Eisenbacteria bacterium]